MIAIATGRRGKPTLRASRLSGEATERVVDKTGADFMCEYNLPAAQAISMSSLRRQASPRRASETEDSRPSTGQSETKSAIRSASSFQKGGSRPWSRELLKGICSVGKPCLGFETHHDTKGFEQMPTDPSCLEPLLHCPYTCCCKNIQSVASAVRGENTCFDVSTTPHEVISESTGYVCIYIYICIHTYIDWIRDPTKDLSL